MTTRQNKVNSLLEHLISSYVISEKFEGIKGILTIKKVEVTADLKHAKVFYSVIGQPLQEVQRNLQMHLGEIQSMLHAKLLMKTVPRIAFAPDTSGEYASHINKLLQNIHHDSESKP